MAAVTNHRAPRALLRKDADEALDTNAVADICESATPVAIVGTVFTFLVFGPVAGAVVLAALVTSVVAARVLWMTRVEDSVYHLVPRLCLARKDAAAENHPTLVRLLDEELTVLAETAKVHADAKDLADRLEDAVGEDAWANVRATDLSWSVGKAARAIESELPAGVDAAHLVAAYQAAFRAGRRLKQAKARAVALAEQAERTVADGRALRATAAATSPERLAAVQAGLAALAVTETRSVEATTYHEKLRDLTR